MIKYGGQQTPTNWLGRRKSKVFIVYGYWTGYYQSVSSQTSSGIFTLVSSMCMRKRSASGVRKTSDSSVCDRLLRSNITHRGRRNLHCIRELVRSITVRSTGHEDTRCRSRIRCWQKPGGILHATKDDVFCSTAVDSRKSINNLFANWDY